MSGSFTCSWFPQSTRDRKWYTEAATEQYNRDAEGILESMRRYLPRTYRLLLGRRYQLPQARQADYLHHDHAAVQDAVITNVRFIVASQEGPCTESDILSLSAAFLATNVWVSLGMASLFVERDLGEALLRTDLPAQFVPEDIHWRRQAFRLFLPEGLFRVESDYGVVEPTCATVVRSVKGQGIPLHRSIFDDLNELRVRSSFDPEPGPPLITSYDDRLTIALQMRATTSAKQAVNYYTYRILDERTLTALAQQDVTSNEEGPNAWSLSEKSFFKDITQFTFNALLYMGSIPQEYEAEKVLRPFRDKGRFKPELRQARFLGQEAYRPAHRPGIPHEPCHTGRRLPGHWRAGHWKRQAYGPGHAQRKLIWVQPYRTLGHDEIENAA
jgi:hypothetical protein